MIDLEYFFTIVGALSEYHNKTMKVRILIRIEKPSGEGEGT